ncbi:MAG: type II secretion system protein [Phycisphaerales bacterium]
MHRRAFTVVEVVVAIGFVLLLLAIAWPRLAATRATARVIDTLSNMRQFGILHTTYADQHRGYFATLLSPIYRGPTDPPERIDLYPGAYIQDDWFGNEAWSWVSIDFDYPRAALLAGGNPYRNKELGRIPVLPDFSLTGCAYAAREYWDLRTQTGPDQWGAQQISSVAFPSEKGLLMQMKTYVFPEYPDGHPACCYETIKTGVLWADLSGSEEFGADLAPGVPNPWTQLTQRAAHPWDIGLPVLQTRDGLYGRDRQRRNADR